MIRLHKSITLAEVRRAADIIGCRLIQDLRGNIVITPERVIEAQAAPMNAGALPGRSTGYPQDQPMHANANVIKFPRRRRPIFVQSVPPGPEAA
jgi:hypothetical protein